MDFLATDLGNQLLLVVAIAAVTLAGPVTTVGIIVWRKRRARAERRSPLTEKLLRGPGHALREQAEDVRLDMFADMAITTTLPTTLVGLHLAQSHIFSRPESLFRLGFTVAMIAASVLWAAARVYRRARKLDHLRLGLDAEVAAGQELNQLMRDGAAVFHDLPADGFNIDHVVVSTRGIFAVETKGYSKPNASRGAEGATVSYDGKMLSFPDWKTRKPLEQAERQAVWLSKWLSRAVGAPVSAIPVVTLPGWFVKRTGRGKVWLFSGKELGQLLKQRGGEVVSEQLAAQVAHQVEQRCRNVAPSYREADN